MRPSSLYRAVSTTQGVGVARGSGAARSRTAPRDRVDRARRRGRAPGRGATVDREGHAGLQRRRRRRLGSRVRRRRSDRCRAGKDVGRRRFEARGLTRPRWCPSRGIAASGVVGLAARRVAYLRIPRSVREADVAGKVVLVRSDLNVPLEDGEVADDTRIRASLPTLELLLDRKAAAITVCSHLGRPKGADPALSLKPVEARLRELFAGELTVLENTRFDPGEAKNDPHFARRLAEGQDLFVQDEQV